MAENRGPRITNNDDAETRSSKTERQEQQEERIQTEERMTMDPTDLSDAIDKEEDQKFDGKDASRYAEETEQALDDDTR